MFWQMEDMWLELPPGGYRLEAYVEARVQLPRRSASRSEPEASTGGAANVAVGANGDTNRAAADVDTATVRLTAASATSFTVVEATAQ